MKQIKLFFQKNNITSSNLLLIIICIFFIFLGNTAYIKQDIKTLNTVYLDPITTAFMVSDIQNFTPNINENLPLLEEKLFFSQAKNSDYLEKKVINDNHKTKQTQLEREYIIQEGDTLTGIANKFDMYVATIYERNGFNADNVENLKTGDKIIIPAYNTSTSQQWLADLNSKKEAERQRLLALEQERLERQRQAQLAYNRNTYTRNNSNYSGYQTTSANHSGYNGYPWGWCTYYAASRRNVPSSWGNAGDWLYSAQRSGYSTGNEPAPGAIMVTGESWWGHVAIVEAVNGDQITVSEMNYNGWGVTSSRTISKYNPVIKGFVY